jgi:hypothetical protein
MNRGVLSATKGAAMPKYKIDYTVEQWYYIVIEAESESDAREKFWRDDIDYQTNPPKCVGDQLSDYINIREMQDA